MLNRIKWEEDTVKDNDGNESANKCVMVWEVNVTWMEFLTSVCRILYDTF
jgi:hypothetical protein